MSEQYETPAPAAGGIDYEPLMGHLLIFRVVGLETGILTVHGVKDAIRADVVDVDTGETWPDALIFPRVLISQLRPKVGGKVLGRLGQGNAKPGQKAPWLLSEATPDDLARAQRVPTPAVAATRAAEGGQPVQSSGLPPF